LVFTTKEVLKLDLAIDTSTRHSALAIVEGENSLAGFSWISERNHTVDLVPLIQEMLNWGSAKELTLRTIVVALGPGGWSSLRVGISAAKGLAEALHIPLVGVGTLELEAFPYASTKNPICPLIEVGRGEVAWGLFQELEGRWTQTQPDTISKLDDVCQTIPPDTVLCGEGAWNLKNQLQDLVKAGARIFAVPPPTRQAFTLARLGKRYLTMGATQDTASLEPIYLRRPSTTPPLGADVAGNA
jgi:tRNA threonylcarbamoyladenosine biosynthesis protein TsaB